MHWPSSGASARWVLAALLIALTAIAQPLPGVGATAGGSGADGRCGLTQRAAAAAAPPKSAGAGCHLCT